MDTDGVEENNDSDATFDEAVQHALVVGDFKEAVAQCVSVNRMSDALVIAHVSGTSLWESTRDQYLKMSHSPYLKVVSAMVNHDLMSLVSTRPLKSWKETLALLCTFAQREEWTLLCDALASKLLGVGNTLAATLCYICSGSIDKSVEIWSQYLSGESEGKSYVDRLQDLMEKSIVFALATGQKHFSTSLCKLVERYVEILASQGQLSTAMEYLKLLEEDLPPELVILRDHIAVSANEAEKITTYENPSVLPGSLYADAGQPSYDTNVSQHYYLETDESNASAGQYSENYQQPFGTYGRGYDARTSYQPTPQPQQQPHFFVPSQSQQGNIPPPVNAEPAVKPFVPAPSPVLRNAEQYQQPPTLGSRLYSDSATSTYQTGPPPVPGTL